MRKTRGHRAIPTILSALLLVACGVACGGDVAGSREGHVLRGAFLDAETGAAVSGSAIYAHFFCDTVDFQHTLDRVDESTYAVRVPEPVVRVRVFDPTGLYHRYEETLTIEGGAAEHDVLLEPTHFVRLFGKVTDLRTGKPVSWRGDGTIGSAPILSFPAIDGQRSGRLSTGANGKYSVRVPRVKLAVQVLDSPLSPRLRELDLTGIEGDEYEYDVELE